MEREDAREISLCANDKKMYPMFENEIEHAASLGRFICTFSGLNINEFHCIKAYAKDAGFDIESEQLTLGDYSITLSWY